MPDKGYFIKRMKALETDRAPYDPHYLELSDAFLPRRRRFNPSEAGQAHRRNDRIINNTATRALRILSSGLMAGITSPARPWFQLVTPDPDLMKYAPVRSWLDKVEERLRLLFGRSNVYNALHQVYEDLGAFHTSALFLNDDAVDILRAHVFPVGSYCLDQDAAYRVDTIYRRTTMTVQQIIKRFGGGMTANDAPNVSDAVRDCWRNGNLTKRINLIHAIEPNDAVDHRRYDRAGMAWRSAWVEPDSSRDVLLHEGGFREFPCMTPRWATTGEDVYGSGGPGMDALGDIKALQHLETGKLKAFDLILAPPMRGPKGLMSQKASLLPGDLTYYDADSSGTQFEPAISLDARVMAIEKLIEQHEHRIAQTLFADLFLMIARSGGGQKTAREIEERHEEKMLQVGPVLDRMQDELIDPIIDRTFALAERASFLPPAPAELQGVDLGVKQINILAMAQKLVSTVGVERLANFVVQLSAAKIEVLDKLNFDECVDHYADLLGVSADLIVPDDEVTRVRKLRAQAQQMTPEDTGMAKDLAGATRDLGQTPMSDDTALQRMMGALGAGQLPAAAA